MTGIDTVNWKESVDAQRGSARAQVRAEHSLDGAVLLFVGRLEPIKGVREMLAALTALTELPDLRSWSVLFVGAGPCGKDIERWAAANPEISVAQTGFVQAASLPQYFAAADIFVLPSLEDLWPLVSLEAIVAGLPQVTSSMVGSAPDLLASNDLGEIIDPRDVKAFSRCLARHINQAPSLVSESSRNAAMTRWSSAAAAARGIASINACLNAQRPLDDVHPSEVPQDRVNGATDGLEEPFED